MGNGLLSARRYPYPEFRWVRFSTENLPIFSGIDGRDSRIRGTAPSLNEKRPIAAKRNSKKSFLQIDAHRSIKVGIDDIGPLIFTIENGNSNKTATQRMHSKQQLNIKLEARTIHIHVLLMIQLEWPNFTVSIVMNTITIT